MRVLHCLWWMGVGGAERQLVQLCSGLIARHVDVHVATVLPGYYDEPLAATGAVTHRLRRLAKYDVTLIPRMMLLMQQLKPDVVTTWLTQMDIVAGIAARTMGVPWIVCERSAADSYPPSFTHTVRARVNSQADAVIANSDGGAQYWRRFIDDARIRVIPNIVPLAQIERAPARTDEWAAEHDLILYVGRFSAEKNLDRLVEAVAHVLARRRARAVFCGDGPVRDSIEQKVAALGIADRTLFPGVVPDVWAWMKRATVVVSVSAYEGNPNTVLEAIACGAPLVVSDIAAHRAIVSDDSAWIVDPSSVEAIAGGLLAALDQPAEAKARATRARGAVVGRSADDIAAEYARVFEQVVARRRTGPAR